MRPEGLCQWKIPMTPSGIKPAAFWLVAQYLDQLYHHVPPYIYICYSYIVINMIYFTSHIQKFCGKTALQLHMSNNNMTVSFNRTVANPLTNRPWLRTLPPPHSYGHQRLQRQFDGLLMMGIVMPETCWAVSVRQNNKFYDWLLHLVGCFIRMFPRC